MDAATFDSTQAGLGTPMWTAPEQGREGWVPSPRADVWALGLLVYYLWTGKPYWKHTGPRSSLVDLSLEIVREELAPASARARDQGVAELLPAGFDAWLSRAVVRDAAQRFADAREAADAFERLTSRRKWLFALVALVALAGAAAWALSR
jgi:serine/threonine protein kinase